MARNIKYFVLICLTLLLATGVCYSEEQKLVKPQKSSVLKVDPKALNFNCNILEREKQIKVTNLSRQVITINGETQAPWIKVEPANHPDVIAGGTAFFGVSVDCKQIAPPNRWTGKVIITGGRNNIPVTVTAKPKLETPAPPARERR